MSYAPHQQFIAPARPTSEIWRTLVGVAMCLAIYTFCMVILSNFYAGSALNAGSSDSPFSSLFILYSFIFMTLGPVLTVLWVHKRAPSTLFGSSQYGFKNFWLAIKAVVLVQVALFVLPPYGTEDSLNIIDNVPLGTWVLLLPLSLVGIFIQTSAEEILFRGYLQQQLAARFSSPIFWMVIPAVLFSLGHYDPANGVNSWTIVIWAAAFSMAASDLVARTGNLGAAIGLHFINNLFGILIVAYPSSLSSLSLYLVEGGPSEMAPIGSEMLLEFAMLGVSWLAIRLAVRR